jgi:hypothetical protein
MTVLWEFFVFVLKVVFGCVVFVFLSFLLGYYFTVGAMMAAQKRGTDAHPHDTKEKEDG